MSGVIPCNLRKKRYLYLKPFSWRPQTRHTHTHTHTDTHTQTRTTIAYGEMQCVAFRLKTANISYTSIISIKKRTHWTMVFSKVFKYKTNVDCSTWKLLLDHTNDSWGWPSDKWLSQLGPGSRYQLMMTQRTASAVVQWWRVHCRPAGRCVEAEVRRQTDDTLKGLKTKNVIIKWAYNHKNKKTAVNSQNLTWHTNLPDLLFNFWVPTVSKNGLFWSKKNGELSRQCSSNAAVCVKKPNVL